MKREQWAFQAIMALEKRCAVRHRLPNHECRMPNAGCRITSHDSRTTNRGLRKGARSENIAGTVTGGRGSRTAACWIIAFRHVESVRGRTRTGADALWIEARPGARPREGQRRTSRTRVRGLAARPGPPPGLPSQDLHRHGGHSAGHPGSTPHAAQHPLPPEIVSRDPPKRQAPFGVFHQDA